MAKLIKYFDFCVRADAIVYMSKDKKKPGINFRLNGCETPVKVTFNSPEQRDMIYDDWVKAMEEA